MLYIYLELFMKEVIPNFLGLDEWKNNYLFLIETFYFYRNLFLWIMVLTTYLSAILNDNILIESYNNNIKKMKMIEDENKKLKNIIEKLVQRQENYEEATNNIFLNELNELKNLYLSLKNEDIKLIEIMNQLTDDINKKDDIFEKNLRDIKKTISVQKSRITHLNNKMEQKINEINEQYETLSMNDSVSMIENDD